MKNMKIFGNGGASPLSSQRAAGPNIQNVGETISEVGQKNSKWFDSIFDLIYNTSMREYKSKFGFTLAEVLITLGIIGVVAALTIPTLISKYQKKQVETKLKQTYSVLSQALTMASANGYTFNGSDAYREPSFNRKEYLTGIFNNYIKPYVKVGEDLGYHVGSVDFDYMRSHADYYFKLQSGVLVLISFSTSCYNYVPETGACDEQGSYYYSLIFWVDLNGFAPPNEHGKDVFLMGISPSTNKFGFYPVNPDLPREQLLNYCKSSTYRYFCGSLIMHDGWVIKDDYPWL